MRRLCVTLVMVGLVVACTGDDTADTVLVTSSTSSTTVPAESTLPPTTTTTTLPPITTTTLPPTPELVTVEDSLDYSPADLGFGPDGLPVLVSSNGNSIVIVTCDDPNCATGTRSLEVGADPPGMSGPGVATVLTAFGDDGSFTVWLVRDHDIPDLLMCSDPMCTDPARMPFATTDPSPNRLGHVVDSHDRTFAFYDIWSEEASVPNIRLTECSKSGCLHQTASDQLLYQSPTGDMGLGLQGEITLARNGAPVAAAGIRPSGQRDEEWLIMVAICNDPQCHSPTISWITPASPGSEIPFVRLAMGPDGNPILAYTRLVENHVDLYLTVCTDPHCTTYTSQTVATTVRWNWDLAVDSKQIPYLVWGDVATDEALIAKCTEPDCVNLTTVKTGLMGTADWFASLAIAPDGYPMVSFHQPPVGLQLFNCLPEICDRLNN